MAKYSNETSDFIESYLADFRKNQDKVILDRAIGGGKYYTILNPLLALKKHKKAGHNSELELIPKGDFDVFHVEHHYYNLYPYLEGKTGFYFKKTTYGQENYGKEKLPLRFDVVNIIWQYIECTSKMKNAKNLAEDTYGFIRHKYGSHYILDNPGNSNTKVSYHLNVPWDKAINTYKIFIQPEATFAILGYEYDEIAGVNFRIGNQNIFISKKPDFSNNEELPHYGREINRRYSQANYFFNLIRSYLPIKLDYRLLEHLILREIPVHWFMTMELISKETIDPNFKVDDFTLRHINELKSLSRIAAKNALNLYLVSMIGNLGYRLCGLNILGQCKLCGEFFRFKKNKKFCSILTDGRDCGKKARNKRYYRKYKDKLKPYYRQEMQITREFMRKH